jgi:xylulokinase
MLPCTPIVLLGVREEVQSKDWKEMNESLKQTSPSNNGILGFFYDDHEILPQNIQGRYFFNAQHQRVDHLDASTKARAVLEGQCLAKRLYLQRANVDLVNHVERIVVTGRFVSISNTIDYFIDTGGASVNADLLQILADILAKPVYTAFISNSGALGGALRAIDVIQAKPNTSSSTVECLVAAQPRLDYTSIYDQMLIDYIQCEKKIIEEIN